MEVLRPGQGGPTNFDSTGKMTTGIQTNEVDKVPNNIKVNQEKVDNIKEEDVKKAVDKLNKFLEDNGTYAQYEFHDKFKNDIMIKIVDKNTKEVIREVPPKKILDMVAKMCEMVGILIDKRA